jgi:hypothetical protein
MAKCKWESTEQRVTQFMHPSLYFKVLLSGKGKTWPEVKREIQGVLELVEKLEHGGATICDRDGAHIYYDLAPGQRDPLA